MIKLSDYIAHFLVEHGIHDIFLVSGGGIMHLLDSSQQTAGIELLLQLSRTGMCR